MTDATGIYAIENIRDRRAYVGATKRGFLDRWAKHRWFLNRGSHRVVQLQSDWNAWGPGWVRFVPLEVLTLDLPFAPIEQDWIDRLTAAGMTCYNTILAYEHPIVRYRTHQVPSTDQDVYTSVEMAAILDVSVNTMILLLRSGEVYGYKLHGQWLIPHVELQRLRALKSTHTERTHAR